MADDDAAAAAAAAAERTAAVAACEAGLKAPYEAAVARVQAALTELKESQAAAGAALQASRDALAPSTTVEELQHAVGYVPVYVARANAAAKEMRALRARVDKAVARAARLQRAATTGETLVPTDLSVYAGAAAGVTSALVGWAGAASSNAVSAATAAATAVVTAAAGAEPEEPPPTRMEPADLTAL